MSEEDKDQDTGCENCPGCDALEPNDEKSEKKE